MEMEEDDSLSSLSSGVSSSFEFDEGVRNGTKERSRIASRRCLDNYALRPLFKDDEVAADMLNGSLFLGDRPLTIGGVFGERGWDDEPSTPLSKALDERIESRRNYCAKRQDALRMKRYEFCVWNLEKAAERGDLEAVHKIFSNLSKDFAFDQSKEWSAVHWSCFLNHFAVARFLLEQGIDPNQTDRNGMTALHWASFQNNASMVEMLIEHGSSINAQDLAGRTPLHEASRQGSARAFNVLLENGAAINRRATNGVTPLMAAAGSGFSEIVAELINCGASLNNKNQDGDTALHLATKKNHIKVVKVLLDAGVDALLTNDFSQTALSFANSFDFQELAALLSEHTDRVLAQREAEEDARVARDFPNMSRHRRRLRQKQKLKS